MSEACFLTFGASYGNVDHRDFLHAAGTRGTSVATDALESCNIQISAKSAISL